MFGISRHASTLDWCCRADRPHKVRSSSDSFFSSSSSSMSLYFSISFFITDMMDSTPARSAGGERPSLMITSRPVPVFTGFLPASAPVEDSHRVESRDNKKDLSQNSRLESQREVRSAAGAQRGDPRNNSQLDDPVHDPQIILNSAGFAAQLSECPPPVPGRVSAGLRRLKLISRKGQSKLVERDPPPPPPPPPPNPQHGCPVTPVTSSSATEPIVNGQPALPQLSGDLGHAVHLGHQRAILHVVPE
ncbi:hypothetical protein EYF80_025409 [Liparis tanakae]|uniref:Uncharacterized protein n=1 Tax=Liparis tanakae TaxID=230148 RepID=A0A4Z2HER8_9TELE|nr:hypothetical protein EYF80_025409 [Liparis tanakae]